MPGVFVPAEYREWATGQRGLVAVVAAFAGQTLLALGGDTDSIFDLIRTAYDIEARMTRPRARPTPGPVLLLLETILRKAPRLPGALCAEDPRGHDCTNGCRQDIKQAIAICHECPELVPCSQWADQRRA